MNYSSRFWLYAPLALFLGLAAWAMGHWWLAAKDLDQTLISLNGHQAIPGVRVTWGKQTISGFPFRLDVVFEDLTVQAGAPRGPVTWHSNHFALHSLTYGRDQDVFEAAGQQTLSWTDTTGTPHTLTFLPATLHASAIRDGRGLSRFDLDMLDAGGKNADGANFTIGRAQFHLRRNLKSETLDLMLSAVEAKGPTPFGDHIRSMEIYGRITAGNAFGRLLAGKAGLMDALMAWRHDRGQFVAEKASLNSSALTTNAAGSELEPGLRALLFPFY
jgi:hypothetical protein